MRTAAKVLAAMAAWVLTVAVVGAAVWLTVTSSPTRLAAISPVSDGVARPGATGADGTTGDGVAVVVEGVSVIPGDTGEAAVDPTSPALSAEAEAREWVDVPPATTAPDPATTTPAAPPAAGPTAPGAAAPTAAQTAAPTATPSPGATVTPPAAQAPAQAPAKAVTKAPAKAPAPPAASAHPGPPPAPPVTPTARSTVAPPAPPAAPPAVPVASPPVATSGDRTSPDRGAADRGTAGRGTAGRVRTVEFRAPAAELVVTCAADGLADLRANTAPGWSGRWARTSSGEVALWFSQDRRVEVLLVGCVGGYPVARDVTPRTRWAAPSSDRPSDRRPGPPWGGPPRDNPFAGPGGGPGRPTR